MTDGARDALLVGDRVAWRMTPPGVVSVNSIGCGDAMAGAIAWSLDRGLEPLEAVRLGMAAAANNLETLLMARLDRRRLEEYSRRIQVRPIEQ